MHVPYGSQRQLQDFKGVYRWILDKIKAIFVLIHTIMTFTFHLLLKSIKTRLTAFGKGEHTLVLSVSY